MGKSISIQTKAWLIGLTSITLSQCSTFIHVEGIEGETTVPSSRALSSDVSWTWKVTQEPAYPKNANLMKKGIFDGTVEASAEIVLDADMSTQLRAQFDAVVAQLSEKASVVPIPDIKEWKKGTEIGRWFWNASEVDAQDPKNSSTLKAGENLRSIQRFRFLDLSNEARDQDSKSNKNREMLSGIILNEVITQNDGGILFRYTLRSENPSDEESKDQPGLELQIDSTGGETALKKLRVIYELSLSPPAAAQQKLSLSFRKTFVIQRPLKGRLAFLKDFRFKGFGTLAKEETLKHAESKWEKILKNVSNALSSVSPK